MNLKVRILIINNLRKGRFKGAMRELVRGSLIMAHYAKAATLSVKLRQTRFGARLAQPQQARMSHWG